MSRARLDAALEACGQAELEAAEVERELVRLVARRRELEAQRSRVIEARGKARTELEEAAAEIARGEP